MWSTLTLSARKNSWIPLFGNEIGHLEIEEKVMKTRNGRTLLLPALATVGLLACASTTYAGIAPNVTVDLSASNGFNQMYNPAGAFEANDTYNYDFDAGDSDFNFEFDFGVDAISGANPEMMLGTGFTLSNNSENTIEFDLVVTVDLQNGASMADYFGSAAFTVTALDGTFASTGDAIFSAWADGNLVDSAYPDPYELNSADGGGTNSDSQGFFGGYGADINNTIAVEFHFSLTGNTTLTHTGSFGIIPAPSALALLGLGGIAGRRRRRG